MLGPVPDVPATLEQTLNSATVAHKCHLWDSAEMLYRTAAGLCSCPELTTKINARAAYTAHRARCQRDGTRWRTGEWAKKTPARYPLRPAERSSEIAGVYIREGLA